MAIYYLDADDEITSAAAKIRDSSDNRIALVLSNGSRVATSRINFRLLAREAKRRGKRLAIIAADTSVQYVARTAELPVYASVGDYERSETAMAGGPGGRTPDAVKDALDELALTVVPGKAAASSAMGVPVRVQGARPAAETPRHGGGVSRSLLAAVLLLLVLVAGAAGFFLYPSANVVLTLREDPVGPMTVSVTVDPGVSSVNDQAGTVPGISTAFPLTASGTFDATGQKVVETAASGTVTFTSLNTVGAVPVLAGTQVTTTGGVAFATTSTVNVPKATVSGSLQLTPGKVSAPVQAIKKGTAGNVGANKIVRLPADLASFLISVTNKAATAGGTHTVTQQIQQSDIDAAQKGLQSQLESALTAKLKGSGAVPAGSTVFPESAKLGAALCTPDPAGLAGQDVASFQMDCQATGTAIVADVAAVKDVATHRVGSAVKTGHSLVTGSVTTKVGAAVVDGSKLVVPVTVEAGQVQTVDVAQLKADIMGKTLDDAKSYLSQYGKAEITLSPDWVSTVPNFEFRIDIKLTDASAQSSAGPTATRVPSGTGPRSSAATEGPSGPPGGSPTPAPTDTPLDTPAPTDTPVPTDTPAPPTDNPTQSPSPS